MVNSRANFEHYFWRTAAQQEIDLVEIDNGQLRGYEMKWNPLTKARIPVTLRKGYPDAELAIVTPENYLNYVK
jgi:uncharacterized protein